MVNFELLEDYHEYGQILLWCILYNFNVVLGQYRHNKHAMLAHSLIGMLLVLGTIAFILVFLVPLHGFNVTVSEFGYVVYIHAIVGLILFGLIGCQLITGILVRMLQRMPSANTRSLAALSRIHRVLGWIVGYVCKGNILLISEGYPLFPFIVCLECVWAIVFVFMKFNRPPKVTTVALPPQTSSGSVRQIRSISQLTRKGEPSKEFFIFADQIYDIEPLKTLHPGGYKILQPLLGRQVDRFVYGMYSSELSPSVPPRTHSVNFMKLADPPLARLVTPNPYLGFPSRSELADVQVKFFQVINDRGCIVMLALRPTDGAPFVFGGYTSLSQLGQYYSLTYNKTTTRLYTSVNSLNETNISFLSGVFESFKDKKRVSVMISNSNYDIDDSSVKEKMLNISQPVEDESNNNHYLPLLIKLYSNGALTKSLYNDQYKNCSLQLSKPRGRGLDLEATPSGTILIIAGGTGLYPFMDFIDLKFKQKLISWNHPKTASILNNDPILRTCDFSKWKVNLLLAIQEPSDLHPLTLHQLNYLSKDGDSFTTLIRLNKHQEMKKEYPCLNFTTDRFEGRNEAEVMNDKLVRIWLCGPPSMNNRIATRLIEGLNFPRQKLLIV